MVWAQIGQAVGGLAMSLFNRKKDSNSALTNLKLNKKLMKYQYDLERQSRQTSFQDTKQDLLSAGYNPILAVGHQSNYVPVSSGVSAESNLAESNRALETLGGISSAMSSINRNKSLNKTDLITALSNQSHNNADIDWINSKNQGQILQNGITSATGMTRALSEIDEIVSRTNVNKKQVKALESQIIHNNLQNMAIQSGIETSNSAIQATNRVNAWHKRHPKLSGWVTGMNALFGSGGMHLPPIMIKGSSGK